MTTSPAPAATPALPPALGRALAPITLLALIGLYLVGLPSRVANPLYGLGLLVLLARARSNRELVQVGLPLALITTCGALITADLGIRTFFAGKVHFRPLERLSLPLPAYPELQTYQANARVAMDTFGDIAAASPDPALRQPRPVVFETDSLGWRNPAGLASEPLDAVALGDSFTLGAGSSQEQTWVHLLNSKYGKKVYDLAFPADPTGEVLLLKATLPKLKVTPETALVWSLFEGNDFRPTGHPSLNLPPPAGGLDRLRQGLSTFRNRSPLRSLLRRILSSKESVYTKRFQVGAVAEGGPVLFYQEYLDEVQKTPGPDDPGLTAVTAAVKEMVRFTQEQRLRLVVLGLPVKARIYPHLLPAGVPPPLEPSPYLAHLAKLAEELGFEYHSIDEDLRRKAAAGPLLWWRDDTHWGPAGNAAYAEVVARRL